MNKSNKSCTRSLGAKLKYRNRPFLLNLIYEFNVILVWTQEDFCDNTSQRRRGTDFQMTGVR